MSQSIKILSLVILFVLVGVCLSYATPTNRAPANRAPSSQAPEPVDKTKSDDRDYGPGPRGNVPLQNPVPKPPPAIDPWETFYQNSTHEVKPINQYVLPGEQVTEWSCPVGYRCQTDSYGSREVKKWPDTRLEPRCLISRSYFDRHEAGTCFANWSEYDCRNDQAGCQVGTTASS